MAARLLFAVGGTRSGKSRWGLAETRRLAGDGRAWFLATALPGDTELDDRIARHRRERPAAWPTVEVGTDLVAALAASDPSEPVLIDGLTLWLSLLLVDESIDIDPLLDGPVNAALAAIRRTARPGRHRQRRCGRRDRPDASTRARLSRPRRASSISALPRRQTWRCYMVAGLPVVAEGRSVTTLASTTAMDDLDALARAIESIAGLGALDPPAMAATSARLDRLTKPPGSLGRLESLAVTLAGITGLASPTIDRREVIVAAADHGVARRGVSAYPPEVTAQMVANFVAGGAAISVLASRVGARLTVVDVGVASAIPSVPDTTGRGGRLISARIRAGTADMTVGPAMTRRGSRGRHRGRAARRFHRPRGGRTADRDRGDGHRQHDSGERADRRDLRRFAQAT